MRRLMLSSRSGETFEDHRDTALIRFMFETGTRLSEVAALTLDDLDVRQYEVAHVRGKVANTARCPWVPKR